MRACLPFTLMLLAACATLAPPTPSPIGRLGS
jgi:hypothetical protein